MSALIYVFIIMAILMQMFCMFVVARDVFIEGNERRNKKENYKSEEKQVVIKEPETKEEPKTLNEAVDTATNVANDELVATAESEDSAVTFSRANQTLDEKYLELSTEYKKYYDEIVKYAMAVEGSKRVKNESYEEYKVGKNRIVRLKIRRGVVISELLIPNLTFKTYLADNKVSMKQAPTTIKVLDDATLIAVKDSIDIAVKAIEEEKAYKKEQVKLRRRELRKIARENKGEENK